MTCSVVAQEVEAAMKQTIEAFENQIQRLAIPYTVLHRAVFLAVAFTQPSLDIASCW